MGSSDVDQLNAWRLLISIPEYSKEGTHAVRSNLQNVIESKGPTLGRTSNPPTRTGEAVEETMKRITLRAARTLSELRAEGKNPTVRLSRAEETLDSRTTTMPEARSQDRRTTRLLGSPTLTTVERFEEGRSKEGTRKSPQRPFRTRDHAQELVREYLPFCHHRVRSFRRTMAPEPPEPNC